MNKRFIKRKVITIVTLLLSLLTAKAQVQYNQKYVDLGHQSAALYEPAEKTEKSSVAVVVMHSHQDYMNFIANAELAKRGYTVLATQPSSVDIIENKILNIKSCVEYLRKQSYVRKVILLGHSGGGTVISAYQYLAENGRNGLDGKLYQDYSHQIDNLPQADGIMLFDANPGLSTIMLNSLDPNVTDETTGYVTSNKYNYEDEKEYMRGQQERYSRIVKNAQKRLELIKKGEGLFADDEPLIIPGSQSMRFYNKLYSSNTKLLSETKGKWPIIHADGSITTEKIYSVRAPFNPVDKTEFLSTAQMLTVRSFLSTYAMNTNSDYEVQKDGFKGLSFESNLTTPIGNITGIHIPSLFMGMTGSYEYITSEAIYNNSPSTDKTLVFVEGAGHMFVADKQAEKYNNKTYGNTLSNMFDYVDEWLKNKFVSSKNLSVR